MELREQEKHEKSQCAAAFFIFAGLAFSAQNLYNTASELSYVLPFAGLAGVLCLSFAFASWRCAVPAGFSLGYGFLLLGVALGNMFCLGSMQPLPAVEPFVFEEQSMELLLSTTTRLPPFLATTSNLVVEPSFSHDSSSSSWIATLTQLFMSSSITIQFFSGGILLILFSLAAQRIWPYASAQTRYIHSTYCSKLSSCLLSTVACSYLLIGTAFVAFVLDLSDATVYIKLWDSVFWSFRPIRWDQFDYALLGNVFGALAAAWAVVARRPSSNSSVTRCLRTTLLSAIFVSNLATGLVVLTGAPSFLQWRQELMSTDAIPFVVSGAYLLVLLLLHPCLDMERVSSSGAVVPPVLNYHQERYKAPLEPSYKRIYATPRYPTPYAPVVAASAAPYYVTPSMMPYAAVPYPPPDYDARRVYAI